jgi:hypothetical protein
MKLARLLTLAAVSTFACAPARAEIVGPMREAFVNAATKSCVDTQKKNAANAGISDNVIAAYCTCTVNYIADRVTPDQVMLAAEPVSKGSAPSWMSDYAVAGSKYCLVNLSKFLGAPT